MKGRYMHKESQLKQGHTDTGKTYVVVYCAHFTDKPGILSSPDSVCTAPSIDSIKYFTYHTSFSPTYSDHLCLSVIWACLYPFSSLCRLPIGRLSLTLGLMDTFLDFKELPPIPPVATVVNSGTFYLGGTGGDSGVGGVIHQ